MSHKAKGPPVRCRCADETVHIRIDDSRIPQVALQHEPAYRVRGILTDGFDSTTKSLHTLFPGARLGNCLRHALIKLPKKIASGLIQKVTSPRSRSDCSYARQFCTR
jgi:hypothetical protein